MKTKKLFLLATFLFFMGSQVVSSQSKTGDLPVFDFSKDYPQTKMRLQEIADIEYVPLETTDDILLSGMASLSAVTDKYILVHEFQRGDIFVFDRKTGKLYSHFNHKGSSGMEYTWIKNGTLLDEKKEEIYVCSQYIFVYSLKGEYRRTLKINGFGHGMKILNFDDESLLIYDDVTIVPGREKETTKDPYRLVSKKDGSLISVLDIHFSKRYSNAIIQKDGNMYRPYQFSYLHNMHYGQDLVIMDISSDTLFLLSPNKGLTPILTRKPSVHASEPLNIWTPFFTIDKFIQFGTFLLDFNSKGGGPMPTFMYDFKTGEISKLSILDAELGVKPWGSLDEWGPGSTPSIAKNMAAEMIQASSMIEAYQKKRLVGNGNEVAKKLVEDDNPVVRILKFK